MYSVLAYPLDVIKTNRILNTPLAKEAGEALPKEFLALHERGALRGGLFRGYVPFFLAAPLWMDLHNEASKGFPMLFLAAGTVTLNPLSVLQTQKQIVKANEGKVPRSYGTIVSEMGSPAIVKLFTLGVTANLLKNFAMGCSFLPRNFGNED